MKNQCKTDARKSDAKIMKNERKWSPKGSQNPSKINAKPMLEKVIKNNENNTTTNGANMGAKIH